ncbi:hypothetical protein SADUNF_Sadunf14G0090000 [Salix dunnii]|uniref:Pentatricopeptide repeat-containing protein n=1 Tax=Salix dunnii TaxID=1413687 RepID=A0A835JGI3_9ROSI|nr:hypothetical protein SADUNF_Sadunf14G0090000 [Salix dunnii]
MVVTLRCFGLSPPSPSFRGFSKTTYLFMSDISLLLLPRLPHTVDLFDSVEKLVLGSPFQVIGKYKMIRRCLHSNWLSSFKGPDSKFIPLNQRHGRGGQCSREQVCIPGSNSLPFSHSCCSSHDCTVSHTHNQIPYVWPYSSAPRTILQEKLSLILNSTASSKPKTSLLPSFTLQGKVSGLSVRWFSSSNNDDADSDAENEENDESDNCESETKGASVKSTADPEELHKVCKVIDELFALDHNMEAVLDECGINLSHDLVIEVLERFRHARKPAFRFFCWAAEKPGFVHDSRTYHSMMIILAKARQFETMMSMLEEMGEKRLLTLETFSIAMRAFAAAKERKKAVGIFELMKNHKYKVGVETINALLDSLGRAKLGKEAQALFGKLEGRFTPDLRTYTVLLNGWCRVKNLMEAGRIWNEMLDRGFKPDIVTHNIMLEGLLRSKRRSDAIKFFEVMKAKGPSPDVRSYTILIRDLCKQTKMKEAVGYFYEMVDSGCHPDAAVYTCLMTGYGNHKRMDMVYELLKEMKEKGCPPDGKTYNALIKLMTSQRMPDDAVRIYKKMIQNGIEPSIHSYNMIMKSYFQVRNFEMGHAVWDEMSKKGFCPDDNSYTVFIGGLISQNRSEEACKYLEEMIEKGMKAPQLDYNKFAADFSRAGKPDILEELAQKMKFSGKFEVSNVFARWAEMMKKRVKRREPGDRKCTQLAHDQRYSFYEMADG